MSVYQKKELQEINGGAISLGTGLLIERIVFLLG